MSEAQLIKQLQNRLKHAATSSKQSKYWHARLRNEGREQAYRAAITLVRRHLRETNSSR